jgi:hypothetical protein
MTTEATITVRTGPTRGITDHAHLCHTSGDSVRLAQPLHGKGVKPLTSQHQQPVADTLMGSFVSATGPFLSATNGQFPRPPMDSQRCPLTFLPLGSSLLNYRVSSDRQGSWRSSVRDVQIGAAKGLPHGGAGR